MGIWKSEEYDAIEATVAAANATKADKLVLETEEKTADYTLVLTDQSQIVLMNKTGAGILTVPAAAEESFIVGTVVGVYNASSDVVTVEGQHASYSDTPAGAASTVTITADNDGTAGNVTLTGDGVSNIDALVLAHNGSFPSNTLTVDAGGTEIPDNAVDMVLSGGVTVRNGGDLAQYGEISVRKRATDEWVLFGTVS